MCGIFGYVGNKECISLLIEGLKKLEYRGYDSAGVAVINNDLLIVEKCAGKITELEKLLSGNPPIDSHIGIAHTRWATHGRPSSENSHPHTDCKDEIAVVHNGIVENYLQIRRDLSADGHVFKSATDTEVIAHLIEKNLDSGSTSLEEAVRKTVGELVGSFAIAVVSKNEPDKIIVAKRGSPLKIGLGDGETFIASDIPALIKYTGRVIFLGEEEMAVVTKLGAKVTDFAGNPISKEVTLVSWDPVSAEKGGYAHFMLKEIHEQPGAIRDTIADRIKDGNIHFEELEIDKKELAKINRVVFTACGTSWHAGLIGEYMIEQFVKIPCEVEYAAEFRYRHPVVDSNTLVIAISQSGETADTMGAVWEAKSRGAKVISICNVLGSSIARESDGVLYTYAGPEIGVASTKAFTTQIVVIYLFSIMLGVLKNSITPSEAEKMIKDIFELPQKVELILMNESKVEALAEKLYKSTNALYLGRGKGFPIALEGALKLKEVSYIHAEGYPAAEMKHGPIALIDKNMPVVVIALRGRRYDKILGNIEEVKARGGYVVAIAVDGDTEIRDKSDDIFYIPHTTESLSPILAVIPLQLLAYYIAIKRGCHVDQPRNLAKSVTVE
jgi:glucosamine--fructose-6-phosphate aminotransferase (isomerizing)